MVAFYVLCDTICHMLKKGLIVGVVLFGLSVSGCASSAQTTIDTGNSMAGNVLASTLAERINVTRSMDPSSSLISAAQAVLAEPSAIPQGYTATFSGSNILVTATNNSNSSQYCVVLTGATASSKPGPC